MSQELSCAPVIGCGVRPVPQPRHVLCYASLDVRGPVAQPIIDVIHDELHRQRYFPVCVHGGSVFALEQVRRHFLGVLLALYNVQIGHRLVSSRERQRQSLLGVCNVPFILANSQVSVGDAQHSKQFS